MKNILKISFAVALSFTLGSCLKDKDYEKDLVGLDLSDAPKVVELVVSSNSSSQFQSRSINAVNQQVELEIGMVRLAAAEPASEDITVTIDTSNTQTAINGYNTANPAAGLVRLPINFHSFSNGMKVVIKKGTRESPVLIKTNANDLGLVNTHAINTKLVSVSGSGYLLSGNFNKMFTIIAVKNAYDGVYEYVSGLVTRYTSPGTPAGDALSGPLGPVNPNFTLVTLDGNSCRFSNLAASTASIGLSWSGGTSGVAGIDGLRVAVDQATNAITLTSSGNPTLANFPGKINDYNPTTRTFRMAMRWNPTANVREYELIFKYKGPR